MNILTYALLLMLLIVASNIVLYDIEKSKFDKRLTRLEQHPVTITFVDDSPKQVEVSVPLEHQEWLLKELKAIQAIKGIDAEITLDGDKVSLTNLFGGDDWEVAFELSKKFRDHLSVADTQGDIECQK